MLKSPQAYAAEVLDTCFGDKDSALSSLYTIARNIEALPPLNLKGYQQPVPAFRLKSIKS